MNIKSVRKRISTVVLGVGTAALASACTAGEATQEDLASVEEGFTKNTSQNCNTATQIAAEIVRTAMIDLGRYRPGLDLVKGQNGAVQLTSGGLARCASRAQNCARLKSLLSYQTLTNMDTAAMTPDYPWMDGLQPGNISNAIASSMSDAQNPNPNQVMTHDLTFSHTAAAPPLSNCGADLKYHCFNVSGLPAGKTAADLATQIRNLFFSNAPLYAMTRVFAEGSKLCIDPDGIGDDQTGGGSTGGSTCTDGSMAILFDAALVGSCCTKPAGTGYLVQNALQTSYMLCKMTDVAAGKVATADSSLASNPASNAVDASMTTAWIAADSAANHKVAVDFGTTLVTVKGVVFKLGAAVPAGGSVGYKIETSANGTSWVQKKVGTTTLQTQDVTLAPAVTGTKAVRVTLTSLPAGMSASLASIKVFTD